MRGVSKYIITAILGAVILLAGACTGQPPVTTNPVTTNPGSPAESQQIAEKFVRNEATFVFDGMPETLKLVDTQTLGRPDAWQIVYEYQCRQAGYGDRTGQMLAQVITPHRATVTVEGGTVRYAFLDGQWDMLGQKLCPT